MTIFQFHFILMKNWNRSNVIASHQFFVVIASLLSPISKSRRLCPSIHHGACYVSLLRGIFAYYASYLQQKMLCLTIDAMKLQVI